MSYHIYTTKGLVLKERALKEADKSVKILTRDLGLINAVAIGARKSSSKRSPALTALSLGKFSLVRGKKDWRVTNAELDINIYSSIKKNKKLLHAVLRPLSLVEKLIQGEEKNKKIFNLIEHCLMFVMDTDLNSREVKAFEIYMVAKIMGELGYLDKDKHKEILLKDFLNTSVLNTVIDNQTTLIKEINKGIRASGLV